MNLIENPVVLVNFNTAKMTRVELEIRMLCCESLNRKKLE